MYKMIVLGLFLSGFGVFVVAMDHAGAVAEHPSSIDDKLRTILKKIVKRAPFQGLYKPVQPNFLQQIPSLTTQALLRLKLHSDVFDELNDLLFPDSSIWANGSSDQCKASLDIIKTNSLVHAAIRLGYVDAFSFIFCKLGLNKEQRRALCALRDHQGNTPLHVAVLGASRQGVGIYFVRALIDAGADCTSGGGCRTIGCKSGKKVWTELTPLHMVTTAESARALIAARVDINAQNNGLKVSPAHIAAAAGSDDVLKELIRRRASINLLDWRGKTPLDYAREQGDQKTIKMLEEAKKSYCST